MQQSDAKRAPDVSALFRWIASWVQPNGAVYGFHNHSVWGGNPYRHLDFTCGHSTWASPLLPALARLEAPDTKPLLDRLVRFQANSFAPDNQFAHVGFQIGEQLTRGLIHNAIAAASLCETALLGKEMLSEQAREAIRLAAERAELCHAPASAGGTCNQEYARVWFKLLYERAFGDRRFYDSVPDELDLLTETFHVRGVPDEDCEGTLRAAANGDVLEPAEYHGLMILPLVLAAEVYGQSRYLEHATRLARHVARSAWRDEREALRFHRLYRRIDERWLCINRPMLVSGMGDTLEGVLAILEHNNDAELATFLDEAIATMAAYQHAAGFVVPATGWHSEADVAPSSAWHAHDARFLARWEQRRRDGAPREAAGNAAPAAVLLGPACVWAERDGSWAILNYENHNLYNLRGRKDHPTFGKDMGWIGGPNQVREELRAPPMPSFLKTDTEVICTEWPWPEEPDVAVMNGSGLTLRLAI